MPSPATKATAENTDVRLIGPPPAQASHREVASQESFLSNCGTKTWVRFGSIKRRIPYKTVVYHAGLSKKNHQHSILALVSGTRGRRFKSSQARHLFNYLHARSGPLAPYCGDFCGDPKSGS